jgi:hypothetical protein
MDIPLTNVRLTATTALNGSPTDSLSARAPGTADTVDTMDAGSGISMTAGTITMDVVDSAAILDVEVTEERVSAANVAGVAILVNAASEAASVVSTAANLTAEVSAAKASEVANRTVEVVSVAVTAHEVGASAVAAHEAGASAAVDPTAEAARMVEDIGKVRLS